MTTNYPPTSRYFGLAPITVTVPGLGPVPCLPRRLIPLPDTQALLTIHVVKQGERPDLVAFQHFGDPLAFWRVCDANAVLRPEELTETIGRRLRITLPPGIPGPPNA